MKKKILRTLWIFILASTWIFVIQAYAQNTVVTTPNTTPSAGNDVYNFYFQKAPGPQTVIQGGAQPAQPNAVVNENGQIVPQPQPAPVTSAPASVVAATPAEFKRWAISFGGGYANYDYGSTMVKFSGIGIGAEYNLNPYVALIGFANYAKESDYEIHSSHYYGSNKLVRKNPLDAGLGVALTPLRINMFGFDLLEMGVVAGGTTYDKIRKYPEYDSEGAKATKTVKPFIGPRIAINLSKEFGLIAEGRFVEGTRSAATTHVGLRVKF